MMMMMTMIIMMMMIYETKIVAKWGKGYVIATKI